MNGGEQVWAHRPSVIQVGDEERTVLLDLDDAAHPPRILTGPAAAVWHAVDGARDVTGVCAVVAQEYGLAPDDVVEDVRGFIGGLVADDLLTHAPEVTG